MFPLKEVLHAWQNLLQLSDFYVQPVKLKKNSLEGIVIHFCVMHILSIVCENVARVRLTVNCVTESILNNQFIPGQLDGLPC
jgi:hypothetical protein